MTNEHLADLLPDRQLSSAQEIAVLYSLCETFRKEKDYLENSDSGELTSEQLGYLTPDEHPELWESEEDDRGEVFFARVDLSGEEPGFDSNEPIGVELCDPSKKYKWGYISNPGKAGAAIDYSVTNHLGSSGQDTETVAYDSWGNRFLRGRFENWASNEQLDSIIEEYGDSSVIEMLRRIPESELERLQQEFSNLYNPDKDLYGYVSIKVRFDKDGSYLYPSEIPELIDAGIEINKNKLREGRSVSNGSFGQGVGMVSGDKGTVVGASKGVFAKYGKKQPDAFPGMEAEEGWKQRPLTEDTAQHISGFNSVEGDFAWTINGMMCLYLPYPNVPIDRNVFEDFYEKVFTRLRGCEESGEYISTVSTLLKELAVESKSVETLDFINEENETTSFGLRVYAVMAEKKQNSVYNIWLEEPNVSLKVVQMANEYIRLVDTFSKSELYGSMVNNIEYSGLLRTEGILKQILYGSFFEESMLSDLNELESSSTLATEDDRRLKVTSPLLRGNKVNADKLLSDYVTRLERMHRDSGDEYGFPGFMVIIQMMQLASLDVIDGLSKENIKSFDLDTGYCNMSSREERLTQFIEDHNALDSSAQISVFALGGLVGRLSKYQDYNEVSSTLIDQYPISSVSKRTINKVATEVLEKNFEYEGVEGIELNSRYKSILYNSMLMDTPSDWPLSNNETRWLYALGIAYGQDDKMTEEDKSDNEDTTNNQSD